MYSAPTMAVWILLLLLIPATTSLTAPLFKQCDPQWGNDIMGVPGTFLNTAVIALALMTILVQDKASVRLYAKRAAP